MADITQEMRIVEALLFAATEPVTTDFLAERLPAGSDIGAILEDLRGFYEGRGVNIARVAGKWCLRTAEDLAPHLRIERKVSRKLSRAAIESLAIVAYHQPVTRSEVEEIRGVSVSKGSFDVLLEEGWIKPVGRRRSPGRPTTWGTTQAFLEDFGLDSLADLPGVDELRAAGLLDTRPAGTIIGDTGEFYADAEAEGAPADEDEALDPEGGEGGETEAAAEDAAGDEAEIAAMEAEAERETAEAGDVSGGEAEEDAGEETCGEEEDGDDSGDAFLDAEELTDDYDDALDREFGDDEDEETVGDRPRGELVESA
jgi:segregation and condensation protein B